MLIRLDVADFLRECGYQVIEAANAHEAIAVLEAAAVPIDLVFSDIQMPGTIGGFGLARWVLRHRPAISVILTSGFARTADLGEELCSIGPIEPKPYHGPSLAKRIETTLNR